MSTHDIKDYSLSNIGLHRVIPDLPIHNLMLYIVWAYLSLLFLVH